MTISCRNSIVKVNLTESACCFVEHSMLNAVKTGLEHTSDIYNNQLCRMKHVPNCTGLVVDPAKSVKTVRLIHQTLIRAEWYRFVALCFPAPPVLFPLLSTLLPLLLSSRGFLNISSNRTWGKTNVNTETITVEQCSLVSSLLGMCSGNFLTRASNDSSSGYKPSDN